MWRIKYNELVNLGLLTLFNNFEIKSITKKINGSLENLGTKMILSTNEINIDPEVIETDSIFAFRLSKKEDFVTFYNKLTENKELEFEGRRISYEKSIGKKFIKRIIDGVIIDTYHEAILIEDKIDKEFTKLKEPYEGFYNFTDVFLGRDVGSGISTWVEVKVPLDELLKLDLFGNWIRIDTQLDPNDVELSIIVYIKDGTIIRKKVKLIELDKYEDFFIFTLPENMENVKVFPIYKEIDLGTLTFRRSSSLKDVRFKLLEILNLRAQNFVSETDLINEAKKLFPLENGLETAIRKEMMPSSVFLRTHGYVIVHEISDGATFEAKITSLGSSFIAKLETDEDTEETSPHTRYSEGLGLKNIIKEIKEKLRSLMYDPPENEGDVQKEIEKLFTIKDYVHTREKVTIPYSNKFFKPDFILEQIKTAVEVKFCNSAKDEKDIIDAINADIPAYLSKYDKALFIVYDLGYIRNVSTFIEDFMKYNQNVEVIVIKH